FWLLNTNTLMALVAICRSTVALSAAVGSFPWVIAVRNEPGVSNLRPKASASGLKMLSDAPTGVPAYLALMSVMIALYGPRAAFVRRPASVRNREDQCRGWR